MANRPITSVPDPLSYRFNPYCFTHAHNELSRGATATAFSGKSLWKKQTSYQKVTAQIAPTKGAGWTSHCHRSDFLSKPVKAYGLRHDFGRLRNIQEEKTGEWRPPSRHKSPNQAIGLDVIETEPNFRRENDEFKEGVRPKTSQYSIPIIVTKVECGSRRIVSANKNGQKVKLIGPLKKGKQLNFHSSLDQDFIELFET